MNQKLGICLSGHQMDTQPSHLESPVYFKGLIVMKDKRLSELKAIFQSCSFQHLSEFGKSSLKAIIY